MAEKTIKLTGQQIVESLNQEKSRLEAVQRGIASVQGILQEVFFAKESIKAVQKTKKGENAMVTLGAGIFLDVKIDETTKVKSTIAGNILIESDLDKALEELEKREKEVQEKLQELDKQQQRIYANINTLGRIVSEAQKARAEQEKKSS